MEGDAGAGRLNPTDADDSSERVGSIVRGTFNPADLQRFSSQSGPAFRGIFRPSCTGALLSPMGIQTRLGRANDGLSDRGGGH